MLIGRRCTSLSLLLLIWLVTPLGSSYLRAVHPFTKVTEGPIVTDVGAWIGCAWSDYDNDGFLDLFVANLDWQLPNALYRNNRDGTFTRVEAEPFVADMSNSNGGVWGDYNNDGYLDLFVANDNDENNYLYKNNGDGTFERITTGNIVTDGGASRAAAWGDFDRDGWLDLFVANAHGQAAFLYRNNRDGTFARITTGDPASDNGEAQGCAWIDYDADGWLDLLVTHSGGIFIYHSEGTGSLSRITDGELANAVLTAEGLDAGDYDNDADVDLFFANFFGSDFLFRNEGKGSFTGVTEAELVSDNGGGNGCAWGDYDNDGDLDLFVANLWPEGEGNFLYENNGDGTFTRVTEGTIAAEPLPQEGLGGSQGCVWGDYNNDGFLDLFVANAEHSPGATNFLYRNDGNSNSWIRVRCVGTKSNRAGFGAKVRVRAGISGAMRWQMREISGGTGYASQNAPEAHFGLKEALVVDTLRVEWPSGIVQELHDVPAKQIVTVTESSGTTSVPRARFADIALRPDRKVQLTVKGENGKTYEILISQDLAEWSKLQSIQITSADGVLVFVDETAANASVRFYRLVLAQ
jgi:hypothetical protein